MMKVRPLTAFRSVTKARVYLSLTRSMKIIMPYTSVIQQDTQYLMINFIHNIQ